MRVFACMASTLDGKIGPANVEKFVAIGAPYDFDNLRSRRDEANGILFGASTFRAWPKVHSGHNKKPLPHHFIMSRSLDLDPETELFQTSNVSISIFTSADPSLFPKTVPAQVKIVRLNDQKNTILQVMDHIKQQGVTDLLVEGGGQILQQFIEAQVLQELFLTVTPKVMGQINAPNLFGNKPLLNPPAFETITSKIVGDEVYFHFSLQY